LVYPCCHNTSLHLDIIGEGAVKETKYLPYLDGSFFPWTSTRATRPCPRGHQKTPGMELNPERGPSVPATAQVETTQVSTDQAQTAHVSTAHVRELPRFINSPCTARPGLSTPQECFRKLERPAPYLNPRARNIQKKTEYVPSRIVRD